MCNLSYNFIKVILINNSFKYYYTLPMVLVNMLTFYKYCYGHQTNEVKWLDQFFMRMGCNVGWGELGRAVFNFAY